MPSREINDLPQTAAETADDILARPVRCELTGKPYKIIRSELDFYRRIGVPLPRLAPDMRHRLRMQQRQPRELSARRCPNCAASFLAAYRRSAPERVLCGKCYAKAIELLN